MTTGFRPPAKSAFLKSMSIRDRVTSVAHFVSDETQSGDETAEDDQHAGLLSEQPQRLCPRATNVKRGLESSRCLDTDIGWRSHRRLSTFQIRRRRPDVTAAPTTAAFATGAGPGVTALATTAVLATGWPMTPRRARRAALTGISVSFFDDVGVRLDRGDDRLDWNSTVGDQLTT